MTEDMHEERLQAVEAFGDSLVSSTSLPVEVNIVWFSTNKFSISVIFIVKYVDGFFWFIYLSSDYRSHFSL